MGDREPGEGTGRLQHNQTEDEATIEMGGGKGQAFKVIKTLNRNHDKQYEAIRA